jgi:hypothetical protein
MKGLGLSLTKISSNIDQNQSHRQFYKNKHKAGPSVLKELLHNDLV